MGAFGDRVEVRISCIRFVVAIVLEFVEGSDWAFCNKIFSPSWYALCAKSILANHRVTIFPSVTVILSTKLRFQVTCFPA